MKQMFLNGAAIIAALVFIWAFSVVVICLWG